MSLLRILSFTLSLGLYAGAEACRDNAAGLWIAGGSFSCRNLLQAGDSWGIYRTRHSLCAGQMNKRRCCESCRIVNSENPTSAPPVTSSTTRTSRVTVKPATPAPLQDTCTSDCVYLGDGSLPGSQCAWLLDARQLKREQASYTCNQNFAPGCKLTCSRVLAGDFPSTPAPTTSTESCVDVPVGGVGIGELAQDCHRLTDPADFLGIFRERVRHCSDPETSRKCCASCSRVFSGETFPTAPTRSSVATDAPGTPPTRPPLKDTCTYGCVWAGSGTLAGGCEILLDRKQMTQKIAAYYCTNGFAQGCKYTCSLVRNAGENTAVPTTIPPTTADPCVDVHVWIGDGSRDCKYLTAFYPEDRIYGIYSNRKELCKSRNTRCCQSCRRVNSGEVFPDPPTTTTRVTVSTQPRTTAAPPQLKDTCTSECVSGADGTIPGSTCASLLTMAQGAEFCSQGFARGCQLTCNRLLTNSGAPSPTQPETTSMAVCVDSYVRRGKTVYICEELMRNTSDIYSDRARICSDLNSSPCCHTCSRIRNKLTYKLNNENEVIKSGLNQEPKAEPLTTGNTSPEPETTTKNLVKLQPWVIINRGFQNLVKKEEQRRKQMENMFNMLKSIWSSLNLSGIKTP
ncbi:uncharacterized protein LOC128233533 isoform X1 [Mya arenaria]|uniref:uncharacterized protein LOC128233533 isoform X1 n=1 Tax=Mya arenaria TaxID=6604 RepID=UPI0022DEB2CF|nr:uncharacterized protein LOC128233533 isoform X1 [Mya arenaria]